MSVIFRDQLFSITSVTATPAGGRYQLALNAAHPIYGGHFPGNPITPGVVSYQLLEEVFAEHAGCRVRLQKIRDLRFLSFVDPRKHPTISCTLSVRGADDERQLTASLEDEGTTFVRLRADYQLG